jgi:hypothetical protein
MPSSDSDWRIDPVKVIGLPGVTALGLIVAPNGRYVYAATCNYEASYVSCVDLYTYEIAARRTVLNEILQIVMSKSGHYLYCIATRRSELMALNTKANTFAAETVALPGLPISVALSNDGRSVHLINESGALHTVALPGAIW